MKNRFDLVKMALIGLFCVLTVTSTFKKSFTMDEFDNLFSGYRVMKCGDLEFRNVNPPLTRILLALPWLASGESRDLYPNPLEHKRQFTGEYQDRIPLLHFLSKLIVILAGVFACFLIYEMALRLWNRESALGALFCFVLNPTLLANARLATVDFIFAVLNLLAVYALYRWSGKRGFPAVALLGAVTGLVISAKFSGLILFLFVSLFLIGKRVNWKEFLLYLLLTLSVVNLSYGFAGSFKTVDSFRPLTSTAMNRAVTYLPGFLPVPLPEQYLRGFDRQMDLNSKHFPQYLNGRWRDHKVPYYFLFALFYKTPLPLFLLFFAALFFIRKRQTWILLAGPPLLYLILMSITAPNIGVRYILPAILLLSLPAGYLLTRINKWLLYPVILWLIVANLFTFPHYLTFFTYAAGGASRGSSYLLDSNLDWGQDLPLLKNYMDQNGIEKIHLFYFGNIDPGIYGIREDPAGESVGPGYYAVSINLLKGHPITLVNYLPSRVPHDTIKEIRERGDLVDVLGHTLYLFRVNEAP